MADESMSPMDNLIGGNSNSIMSLQQFGIDWLYDLELQQNNLFYVSQFRNTITTEWQNGEDVKNMNLSPYFRVKSLSFEGPSMSFKWHPNMRLNILDQVDTSKASKITINWIEDVYKSVYLYHLNWFQSWYNTEGDYLPIGPEGKYRNLELVVFHFIDTQINSKNLLSAPSPTAEWLFKIKMGGLAPGEFGNNSLKFDMGQSQSTAGVTATYFVNKVSIEVNEKIYNKNDKNTFYLPKDSVSDKDENLYLDLLEYFSKKSNIKIL